ncbi:13142_t:CDS:2 [Cetraspora pellucida]|uniref:13142_t:CDS:1 n=1 Tax=Cetraspora pellucida TaxID=1433469 RepID=A0A9N8ZUP3_9GLOM|nr:13142_t:CDS:2 [Cetraspora pellucida]
MLNNISANLLNWMNPITSQFLNDHFLIYVESLTKLACEQFIICMSRSFEKLMEKSDPKSFKGIATSTKNVKDKKDHGFIYKEHHDLKSFLALKDVTKNTPVYRGQWILPDKRLCVIGPCKALAKKCSPNIIRELEGILCKESEETLYILSSMNGFTGYAIKRYIASPFPIMLITVTDNGRKLGNISWNKAAEEYLKGFK